MIDCKRETQTPTYNHISTLNLPLHRTTCTPICTDLQSLNKKLSLVQKSDLSVKVCIPKDSLADNCLLISFQGGRDPLQPGGCQRSACWHGGTLPGLRLRPAGGCQAVCRPLPASRRHHRHCQRECCDRLRHQVRIWGSRKGCCCGSERLDSCIFSCNFHETEIPCPLLFYPRLCGYFETHRFNTLKQNNKLWLPQWAIDSSFLPRLLRSLIGLKRVIINAAHFLVMKNKEFYRFYQTEPFLETVRAKKKKPKTRRVHFLHCMVMCL